MRAGIPLTLLCFLTLCLTAGTPGCAAYGCGRNSQAVRGAEALSANYLASLHSYVESGQCKGTCRSPLFDRLRPIATRTPVMRVHRDGNATITLAFCFDQGVQLVFSETHSADATISVAWGSIEWEHIVLWSRSETAEPN